jgi:uncharacterized protein YggE
VVTLAVTALAAYRVQAQVQEQRTGVRVTGQGQIVAQPDVVVISLGASVLRDRPDAAFDRAEQLIAAATAVMRENGVAERDISTGSLGLFQEFRLSTTENPQPVLAGWRARHTLSVRLHDFSRIGRVVSGAVAALEDAGEVQGISFTVENNESLIEQARDLALADARQKAERMASRLGFRLGGVIFVQEVSAPFPVARVPTAIPATPRPLAPVPFPAQITPGELSFSVTVEVHFAIEGVPITASGQ